MNIAVVGVGYVGLSMAVLLAKRNHVFAVDIDAEKIDMVARGVSPIADEGIQDALSSRELDILPTTDSVTTYEKSELAIIAVPTDYDAKRNFFDVEQVETVIDSILYSNPKITIVIRSTVPVGYTSTLCKQYPSATILFSPEFLREGHALEDNLRPSRIIVGIPDVFLAEGRSIAEAESFVELLCDGAECSSDEVPIHYMSSTEAEAVKLFANTYLALRVAFFNELDTFAETRGLNSRRIIEGVASDPRIGFFYNNPSFGYGGYCLPKDTKQLLANYEDVPQNLIRAIVAANKTRKDYIADEIASLVRQSGSNEPTIGIYRLTMKSGSDNFRSSSVQGIIRRLCHKDFRLLIYEPILTVDRFNECEVVVDIDRFKQMCDVIVANRWDPELQDVEGKVYTRDLFNRD